MAGYEMTRRLGLAILSLFACLAASPAFAASSAWTEADYASVRLISAVDATGNADRLPMGLEFRLADGWKIYWRTPGDAGLPPIPDWSRSDNVADVDMSWPVPERFEIFDIGTLGYSDAVVFPLNVTPETAGAPVSLTGAVDYLVCAEICIPARAELSLTLPSGPASVTEEAHVIDRFAAQVPVFDTQRAGLAIEGAVLTADDADGATVSLRIASLDGMLTVPDAFVEGPGGAYFERPGVTLDNDGMGATVTVALPTGLETDAVLRDGLIATVVDGPRALETVVMPGTAPLTTQSTPVAVQSDAAVAAPSLAFILGLALLGGIILNLMPCVLPVLSLKLLSVASKSGKEAGQVRTGLLVTASGVVVSFWVLALGAIALRQAGLGVGWGIQFQQPVFLALMVALLTLFACNLIGLFEFRLPSLVGDRAAQAGGGVPGDGRDGYLRDFLTGAFATLLATPCSAPFLGTAVGFALGTGTLEIALVFTMLGLGLSLPYLLVAAYPRMVRVFPKPGHWMIWLKWVLAAALVGTAVWLLSVMGAIIGNQNAAAVGALAAVAAAALATRHLEGSRVGRLAWPVSASLAVACVLSPLAMEREVPIASQRPQAAASDAGEIDWQPFDAAAIAGLVADGRTVFVDVTADWCVTCQWNKRTVLQVGAVAQWLDSEEVVAMRADWTRPDPAIVAFLQSHGRYGIPFNVVYGPQRPGGVALPELLSADAVIDAAVLADPSTRIAQDSD